MIMFVSLWMVMYVSVSCHCALFYCFTSLLGYCTPALTNAKDSITIIVTAMEKEKRQTAGNSCLLTALVCVELDFFVATK